MIISGPETLDTLRSSFLSDYLPASSDGSLELTANDFDEINRHWNLPIRNLPGPPLAPISKWSAVKLKMHPDAQYVPTTGELVVERRIGRGRVVASAFNGEEAVETYRDMETRPDLVLMDHRMPVKNGLEALREIMEMDGAARVVFLTADATVAESALAAGACDVLLKPFRMDVLHKTVADVAARLER